MPAGIFPLTVFDFIVFISKVVHIVYLTVNSRSNNDIEKVSYFLVLNLNFIFSCSNETSMGHVRFGCAHC